MKPNNILGAIAVLLASSSVYADQVVLDDQIVDGSLCVGPDCVVDQEFDFDTIQLKTNNPLIRFNDTSTTAQFPDNDWTIGISDTGPGGEPQFIIADESNTANVLVLQAGAEPAVAIGSGSAVVPGAISVGDTGSERRIVHVEDGVEPQDAATKGQFDAFVTDATNTFAAELAQERAEIDAELAALEAEIADLIAQLTLLQDALGQ